VFSRLRLGLLLAGVALVVVGLGWAWRTWYGAHTGPRQAHRIAILAIDNQTGDPNLNWADGAIRSAAILQLGQQTDQADQATVFMVKDAGDASARRATQLVYGRLEPEKQSGSIRYSFLLEDLPRRTVLRRVQNSGHVLDAAVALAAFIAPEMGVQSLLKPGVGNDKSLELFSTQKFAECASADPQASWCWEQWASSAFEAGRKEEALSILARARVQGTRLSAFARARLDLVEASIRGDQALRMAALERVVQADSSNLATVAELASAFMTNRRFPQAETLYRTSLQRDRSQSEVWNMLAYAQAGQSHFDEARKSLVEYSRLAPASPNPPDSRGEIEWMAGNLAGASTWFLDSYRRDPSFNAGVALEKAALSRYLAGDADGAEDLANKFLSDRERAGDVLTAFHRARWRFLWGDSAGAKAMLETLVQQGGPDAAVAALRLMLADLRDNDIPGAKKWARAVRELTPKTGNPLLSRVAAAMAEGDFSVVPDQALRSELVALRLTLNGEFAPAAAAWDEALQAPRDAGNTFALEMKAWCLLRTGRGAEAASLVKVGWPLLGPDDRLLFDFLVYPNLLFVRAEAASTRGDTVEARRLYDLYLRYAGLSKDRFGQADKARAASRL